MLFSVIRYNSKRYRKKGGEHRAETKKIQPHPKAASAAFGAHYEPKALDGHSAYLRRRFHGACTVRHVGLPVLSRPKIRRIPCRSTVPPTASPAASTEENDLPVLEDSVNLFVINEDHPADAGFAPEETAEFDSVTVDARIVPALTALCDAAKADGVTLKFSGGYVSYAEQESLYNAEVERLIAAGSTKIMAREDAKSTVSAPGTSDLQSGLCVTVQDDPATFSDNGYLRWLQRNMAALRLCVPLSSRKRG